MTLLAKLRLGSTVGLHGKGAFLGVNVPGNPDASLHVNGNAHLENDLTVDGDMTVNETMKIGGIPAQFSIIASKLEITGGDLRIVKNGATQSSEGYNDNYAGAFGSGDNDYVATRYWLYELFDDRLGDPDTINAVVNALQNYSGEPIDQLTWGVCSGIEGLKYDTATRRCVYNLGSSSGKTSPLLVKSLDGTNINSQDYLLSSSCSGGNMYNGITTDAEMECINTQTKVQDAIKAETRTQLTSWGLLLLTNMKSNRGFTLIELMVGVGLTGLISLGVMQLISDTGKISKSTKQQFEEDELTRVLNSLFNNEKVCRSTLFGKDPTGDVGSKIDEVIRLKSIDNIKVFQENPADPTDTDDIDPPEQSQYDTMRLSSTEKRVMVRANCPDTGSASSRALVPTPWEVREESFLKKSEYSLMR